VLSLKNLNDYAYKSLTKENTACKENGLVGGEGPFKILDKCASINLFENASVLSRRLVIGGFVERTCGQFDPVSRSLIAIELHIPVYADYLGI
jgi:hypothetical protein